MIKFRKVTSSKYISNSDYSIRELAGKYFIVKGSTIVKWQTGFSSIKCAELFLNSHNSKDATADHILYSADDFSWIVEYYGFKSDRNGHWKVKLDNCTIVLSPQKEDILLTVSKDNKTSTAIYYDIPELIQELDSYFDDGITAAIICYTRACDRDTIFAAKGKSSRELAKNLVRVKSSNIWAYGINIKDRHDKVGDVIIQFKGRDGGPDGGLYMYFDVPIEVWRGFLSASSKGHYFWVNIRNNYWYRKLDGNKRGVLPNAVN